MVREFGKVMDILLYLKWIISKDLLYSTALLIVMCQPGLEGGWRENGYVYMYPESLHYSPETIKTLLIGYSPIQNVFGVKK